MTPSAAEAKIPLGEDGPAGKTSDAKLRIGLLVDSPFASKYAHELATWAHGRGDICISHLIVQGGPPAAKSRLARLVRLFRTHGVRRAVGQLSFRLLTELESLALRRRSLHGDHLDWFDLRPYVPGSLDVQPLISASGVVYRYRGEDIRTIRSLDLDLLIRCGSGIQRGEILSACRFGMLSFHHGDNRINRGGPAGFWEVYFRQDSTGFVIQQLTEELDGGNVLFRGSFATQHYYLLNQASLCKRSNHYLKELLRDVARVRRLPEPEAPTPYFERLFAIPSLGQQCIYSARLLLRLVKRLRFALFGGDGRRWRVAYAKSDWKNLVMRRARLIENPPGRFLADPFVMRENGVDCCFVEDFDLRSRQARISAYRLGDDGAERLGDALVEPFHMSFPFVFRFNSKIYMCPESCRIGEIRLYECVSFPLTWKLSRVIMSGLSAADTMIFEHGGAWWLFTNIEPVAGGDHCSQLSIFHADSPLSQTWIAHPKNPIFVDSTKARNAGIVFDDGSIYRVAQRQGFDLYGKGFSINRIVTLSATEYVEEEICSVEPNFFATSRATHHLHSNGHVTVFDTIASG
jgi:hypothetical protein